MYQKKLAKYAPNMVTGLFKYCAGYSMNINYAVSFAAARLHSFSVSYSSSRSRAGRLLSVSERRNYSYRYFEGKSIMNMDTDRGYISFIQILPMPWYGLNQSPLWEVSHSRDIPYPLPVLDARAVLENINYSSINPRNGRTERWFTSYDVIAPWPDMTRSIFLPEVAQGLPHRLCKISARSAERLGSYREKN